jgi:hypothetical protein
VQEPEHDVVIETSKERPPGSSMLLIQSKATSQFAVSAPLTLPQLFLRRGGALVV